MSQQPRNRIDRVDNRSEQGIAAVAALTQPVYHRPGEGVLSLGTGYYQGQSAVSFAFGYLDKEGQIGYSAGVGVPFGGSGPVAHAGVSIRLF